MIMPTASAAGAGSRALGRHGFIPALVVCALGCSLQVGCLFPDSPPARVVQYEYDDDFEQRLSDSAPFTASAPSVFDPTESYIASTPVVAASPTPGENETPRIYVNQTRVPVRPPNRFGPEHIAQVDVWWSDTNGFMWERAGTFPGPTYFWFEAPGDGEYGIRFVGPGDDAPHIHAAPPERLYYVDTTPPQATLFIEPNQSWYHTGQTLHVHFRAHDHHLTELPVRIDVAYDYAPGSVDQGRMVAAQNTSWMTLQTDLPAGGAFSYRIPPELVNRRIIFRVAATDRAGNEGYAHSHSLLVADALAVEPGIEEPLSDARIMALARPRRSPDDDRILEERVLEGVNPATRSDAVMQVPRHVDTQPPAPVDRPDVIADSVVSEPSADGEMLAALSPDVPMDPSFATENAIDRVLRELLKPDGVGGLQPLAPATHGSPPAGSNRERRQEPNRLNQSSALARLEPPTARPLPPLRPEAAAAHNSERQPPPANTAVEGNRTGNVEVRQPVENKIEIQMPHTVVEWPATRRSVLPPPPSTPRLDGRLSLSSASSPVPMSAPASAGAELLTGIARVTQRSEQVALSISVLPSPMGGLVAPLPSTARAPELAGRGNERRWLVLGGGEVRDDPLVWSLPRPLRARESRGLSGVRGLKVSEIFAQEGPPPGFRGPLAQRQQRSDLDADDSPPAPLLFGSP
jgi:hypothetical protein